MRRSRVKVMPNLGSKLGRPSPAVERQADSPARTTQEANTAETPQSEQTLQTGIQHPPIQRSTSGKDAGTSVYSGNTAEIIKLPVLSLNKQLSQGSGNGQQDNLQSQATEVENEKIGTPKPKIPAVLSRSSQGHPQTTKLSEGGEASDNEKSKTPKPGESPNPMLGRRNRFMKVKPNIDGTKIRIRHGSVTEAQPEAESCRTPEIIKPASIPSTCIPPVKLTDKRHSTSEVLQEKSVSEAIKPSKEAEITEKKTHSREPACTKKPEKKAKRRSIREILDGPDARPRRKMVTLDEPVDRTTLTIRDLIYMNPTSNPMKSSEEKKKTVEAGEKEDTDAEHVIDADENNEQAQEEAIKNDEEDSMPVPQVTIGPDGQIILNEKSLVIANPKNKENIKNMELVHESENFNKWGYGKVNKGKQWTLNETKKFYLALSTVGTDFTLMSKVFPSRSRIELKRKFKREENINKYLIDQAVKERVRFDQDFMDELVALDMADTEERERKKQKKGRRRVSTDADSLASDVQEERKPRKPRKKKEVEVVENGNDREPTKKQKPRKKPGKLQGVKGRGKRTYAPSDEAASDLDNLRDDCPCPEPESEVEVSLAQELCQSLEDSSEPFIPQPPEDVDTPAVQGIINRHDRTQSDTHIQDNFVIKDKPKVKAKPKKQTPKTTHQKNAKEDIESDKPVEEVTVSKRGRKRKAVNYKEDYVIDLDSGDNDDDADDDDEVMGRKSKKLQRIESDDETEPENVEEVTATNVNETICQEATINDIIANDALQIYEDMCGVEANVMISTSDSSAKEANSAGAGTEEAQSPGRETVEQRAKETADNAVSTEGATTASASPILQRTRNISESLEKIVSPQRTRRLSDSTEKIFSPQRMRRISGDPGVVNSPHSPSVVSSSKDIASSSRNPDSAIRRLFSIDENSGTSQEQENPIPQSNKPKTPVRDTSPAQSESWTEKDKSIRKGATAKMTSPIRKTPAESQISLLEPSSKAAAEEIQSPVTAVKSPESRRIFGNVVESCVNVESLIRLPGIQKLPAKSPTTQQTLVRAEVLASQQKGQSASTAVTDSEVMKEIVTAKDVSPAKSPQRTRKQSETVEFSPISPKQSRRLSEKAESPRWDGSEDVSETATRVIPPTSEKPILNVPVFSPQRSIRLSARASPRAKEKGLIEINPTSSDETAGSYTPTLTLKNTKRTRNVSDTCVGEIQVLKETPTKPSTPKRSRKASEKSSPGIVGTGEDVIQMVEESISSFNPEQCILSSEKSSQQLVQNPTTINTLVSPKHSKNISEKLCTAVSDTCVGEIQSPLMKKTPSMPLPLQCSGKPSEKASPSIADTSEDDLQIIDESIKSPKHSRLSSENTSPQVVQSPRTVNPAFSPKRKRKISEKANPTVTNPIPATSIPVEEPTASTSQEPANPVHAGKAFEPGSLVFVTSNPSVNEYGETVPGAIHVYLVSDTGSLSTNLGSINADAESITADTIAEMLASAVPDASQSNPS